MDYGRVGDAVTGMFVTMTVALFIFVPLGLWKLVEIGIWVCQHIHWQ